MPDRVICDLYARVSTTEQAAEGFSLGEQEARLRAYAAAQGWTVHEFYSDPGFSGAKLDRPGIQAVMRDAIAGKINRVVTYKLDRLSRSQKDTLYLIEDVFLAHGVDYVSMTEALDTGSPFGMAMIGVLSVFAQLEREQIAERMMLGRVASAKEGNWRGGAGVPIGYRYRPKTATAPGELVIDPYEAEVVRKVFSLFLAGYTFHGIYDYCRDRYTTSYGSFAGGGANLIPAMLSNRAYIGEIKYCGVWYPGKHEAILDQETFDRAQDRLVEYRATLDEHRRVPYKAGHLLTGFLFCGDCGARWCNHTGRYRRKDGTLVLYDTYQCYTKNAHKGMRKAARCSIPVWPSRQLEDLVWSQVEALRYEDAAPAPDVGSAELNALTDRISAIDRAQARLVDLYSLGSIPFEMVHEKAEALVAERAQLTERCEVLRRHSTRLGAEELQSIQDRVRDVRDSGTVEEQRDLLRLLIRRIVLLPDREVRIEWNI